MTEVIYFKCDRCKQVFRNQNEIKAFSIPYAERPDPAGGPSETLHYEVHLCAACMGILLKEKWLNSLPLNGGKQFLEKELKQTLPHPYGSGKET